MADAERIKQVIDDEIAPRLQSHGGGIELVSVEDDGSIRVKLTGACGHCPGAMMTLKGVVEQLLREAKVEFKEVVAV